MAIKRKTISKKTRFEVFKRDGFKCQYCGASAPAAILVIDHVEPFSKGGSDEILNYITACQPCNAGKGDRKISDDTVVLKQRAQIDELAERREQIEMMLQWRDGMKSLGGMEVDAAEAKWCEIAKGWNLNDNGRKELASHIKKHGLQAVLDAFDITDQQYIKVGDDGKATEESVSVAWQKVGGILRLAGLPDDQRQLYYVKGILRNRLSYLPFDVMTDLGLALEDGVPIDDMKAAAKQFGSWRRFEDWLLSAREEARGEG